MSLSPNTSLKNSAAATNGGSPIPINGSQPQPPARPQQSSTMEGPIQTPLQSSAIPPSSSFTAAHSSSTSAIGTPTPAHTPIPSAAVTSSVTPTPTPAPTPNGVENKAAKPARTPSSWDPQDDILLRHLKEEKKLGWKEIASHFTNRTPNACQFRWRRLKSGVLKNASNNPAAVTPEQAARAAKDGITAPAPPPLTTVIPPSTTPSKNSTPQPSSLLSSSNVSSELINSSKKAAKKSSMKKAISLGGTIKKPSADGKKISKKRLQQQQQQKSKNGNGGAMAGHVRSFSFSSSLPHNNTFNSYSLSADEKYISNNSSGVQPSSSQKSSVFSTILRGNHRTSFSSNTGFVVTANPPFNNNNSSNSTNQDSGDVAMGSSVPSVASLETNNNINSQQQKNNFNMYSQDGSISHTRHGSVSSVRTQNSSHFSVPHHSTATTTTTNPGAKDPWTPEEDELLLSKRRRELSLTELSILLPWRTEEEIVARIRRLDRRAGRSSFSITSSTGSSHHHIIQNSSARSRFRTGSMSSYTAPPPSSILHPSHHSSVHSTHFTQPYGALTTSRNPRSSFVLVDDPVDNSTIPQISFHHHGRESRMGSISGPPPGGLHTLSRTLSISSQVSVGSNISSFSTATGNNINSNSNNNNSLLYSGSAVYDNDDELLSPPPPMTPISNIGKNSNSNNNHANNTFGFSASAAANGLVMFPLRRTLSSSSTGSVGASISAFRSQIRARSGYPTNNSNNNSAIVNGNSNHPNNNNNNNNTNGNGSESAENIKESVPHE